MISRRVRLMAAAGVALVFVAAFLFLRPAEATLSDAEYIAMAKGTPQGQLYFTHHDVPCTVTRVFTVQVNCDYVAAPGSPTEKFRVHIDPKRNVVFEVEADFDP